MKLSIQLVLLVVAFVGYCSAQMSDSMVQERNYKPYEILNNINEKPVLALDTNGYTFQFGCKSLLENINEYYKKNMNNDEDSMLLKIIRGNNNQTEINVNKLQENIKKRIIYHFADLMLKGKCKIVSNQNKAIINRIAWMGELWDDHTGGWIYLIKDKANKYNKILEIRDK
jgi:hypothetical protein